MSDSGNIWFRNESIAPSFSIIGMYWAIPVSWQGWLVLALYAATVSISVIILLPERWGVFLLLLAGLTLALLLISVLKGKRMEGAGP